MCSYFKDGESALCNQPINKEEKSMNKKEQEILDNLIMEFIKDLREKSIGVYVIFEEVEKCLNDLIKKNKYKSYKVDCSLKNFNYRQHRQEIADKEFHKLFVSNSEILSKWNYFNEERKLSNKDFKDAYFEIFDAYAKTFFFAQENAYILSDKCRRILMNHFNNLKEWLDELINLIESSKEEE